MWLLESVISRMFINYSSQVMLTGESCQGCDYPLMFDDTFSGWIKPCPSQIKGTPKKHHCVTFSLYWLYTDLNIYHAQCCHPLDKYLLHELVNTRIVVGLALMCPSGSLSGTQTNSYIFTKHHLSSAVASCSSYGITLASIHTPVQTLPTVKSWLRTLQKLLSWTLLLTSSRDPGETVFYR